MVGEIHAYVFNGFYRYVRVRLGRRWGGRAGEMVCARSRSDKEQRVSDDDVAAVCVSVRVV